MSFFDDDFYSTKVSKGKPLREPRLHTRGRRFRMFGGSIPNSLIPAACGVLVTVLLFVLVGGTLSRDHSPKSVPVSGTITAAAPSVSSADVSRETSDSVVKAAAKVGPT